MAFFGLGVIGEEGVEPGAGGGEVGEFDEGLAVFGEKAVVFDVDVERVGFALEIEGEFHSHPTGSVIRGQKRAGVEF